MKINNHSKIFALAALVLVTFAAQAQSNPDQSPRPIPETGVGDCEEVGTNLWVCCEENDDEMMTICFIEKEPYDLDRRKPVALDSRDN